MSRVDMEPTEEGYRLGAKHMRAQMAVKAAVYKLGAVKQRHLDELRPLEQELLRAKRHLAYLDESYRELCERLRIDPRSERDIEDDDEDDDEEAG